MTDVVIGMPVFGRLELACRGLRAIDALSPADTAVIVVDDVGPQRMDESMLVSCLPSGRPFDLVSHERNRGFVGSVNDLFTLAGNRDVVVVNSDVEVLPGWFEALALAVADSRGGPVASASAMADNGGILSVPELSRTNDGATLDELRARVPLTAEIPVAIAHCSWFTRAAIDRVGGFDEAFSPGYGEEVDWSLRAARAGFVHRAALGSYVRHAGSASFGKNRGPVSLQRRHEALLLWRYRRSWFAIRRFARRTDSPLALVTATMSRYLRTAGGGARQRPD